jgi:uncharacterized membrane protein
LLAQEYLSGGLIKARNQMRPLVEYFRLVVCEKQKHGVVWHRLFEKFEMKVIEAVWATCKKLYSPFLIILVFLLFSFPLNFSNSSTV